MRTMFLLLLALMFIGGCKIADPQPICEAHDTQGDKHSDAAHATCPSDDVPTPDDDHGDDEPEDDGHGGH